MKINERFAQIFRRIKKPQTFRSKFLFALVLSIIVIIIVIGSLVWYQKILFGDSLVAYIPEETVFYTHINTHSIQPEHFSWYFGILNDHLSYNDTVDFESQVLPLIKETAFLYFSTQEGLKPAFILKLNKQEGTKENFMLLLGQIQLQGKFLSRQVVVLTQLPYLNNFRYENRRSDWQKKLSLINGGYFLTGFIDPNKLEENIEQFYSAREPDLPLRILSSFKSEIYFALQADGAGWYFKIEDFVPKGHKKISTDKKFFYLDTDVNYFVDNMETLISHILPEFSNIDEQFLVGPAQVFIDFLDHGDGINYVIRKEMASVDLDSVENGLKKVLSEFVPVERELVLPDGDVVVEFVKDPSGLLFDRYSQDGDDFTVYRLKNSYPEKGIYYTLRDNDILLGNDYDLLKKVYKANPSNDVLKKFKNCALDPSAENMVVRADILNRAFGIDWFFPFKEFMMSNRSGDGVSIYGCVR